ncbi:MAG: N-terminal phage integrase SAM-like domain-containing protein [Clostridia bacterium]
MLFGDFIELYFDDLSHRLKASTLANKHWIADKKITPVFSKIPLNKISLTDVRKWQNKLTSHRDEKGADFSRTYLKTINNQLTAIFNYAARDVERVQDHGHLQPPSSKQVGGDCHQAGHTHGNGSRFTKCSQFVAINRKNPCKPA